MKTTLATLCLLSLASSALTQDKGQLVYWRFNEGKGEITQDFSGHGHSGKVGGRWVTSPSGGAVELDGTPATLVSTELPLGSRLGKGSWTVSAWVKPKQFSIDSRQNQRRLFDYGSFPQANFCVDLLLNGVVTVYQCYQPGGQVVGFSCESSTPLTLDRWAFVAVTCDRRVGWVEIYVNGFLRGKQRMPSGFGQDLDINGRFDVGSGWQNLWGDVDEVHLFSRAESPAEVKAEFVRLKDIFEVQFTPEEAAANKQEQLDAALADAKRAWANKRLDLAQKGLVGILAKSSELPNFRSYVHLLISQCYVEQGNLTRARAEYIKIVAEKSYPSVSRREAQELLAEVDRSAKGLPARDATACRVTAAPLPATRIHIYVSPNGKDTNPGTKGRPVATLNAARDRVRASASRVGGTIEVDIAPGQYRLSAPLALTQRDSGTESAPVLFRAEKIGTAIVYGGMRVSGFKPVTDPEILNRLPSSSRGKVVQADLKVLGLTDFAKLAVRGFGQAPSPPTLELYVNGEPQTLARWPNKGFVHPSKLVDSGNIQQGTPSVLGYEGDRPSRWSQAEEPWIFGYFQYLWADGTAKIAKIDPVARTLTTESPYHYLASGMTMEQGIKYYAFNLLEEIDSPGEWYLNRATGILYLYPPCDLAKANVEIPVLNTPMVTADHVAHVRFEGLTFDLSRSDGVVLTDSTNCQIVGCSVRRIAGNGIRVQEGSRVSIVSCNIYNIGRRATEIIGGNRDTLSPGGHIVANCSIHDFGRIDRTYTPGVQLEGVGNRVVHNLFYNCPSSAMRIEGNDHVVEYNEFRNVLLESDDQGAIDIYGNPTYRGIAYRFNYFHNLGSGKQEKLVNGQAAIRLDDAISGMEIYGNVFDRAANGIFGSVQINSGRDNVIDNNVFANQEKGVSGGFYAANSVWTELKAQKTPSFITSDLYLKRYPEMTWMLRDSAVNHAWRNVFLDVDHDFTGNQAGMDMVGNFVLTSKSSNSSAVKISRDLSTHRAVKLDIPGFRPIPLNEIGLYADAWRKL